MSAIVSLVDFNLSDGNSLHVVKAGQSLSVKRADEPFFYTIEDQSDGSEWRFPAVLANKPLALDPDHEMDPPPINRVTVNLASGIDQFSPFLDSFFSQRTKPILEGAIFYLPDKEKSNEVKKSFRLFFNGFTIYNDDEMTDEFVTVPFKSLLALVTPAPQSYWTVELRNSDTPYTFRVPDADADKLLQTLELVALALPQMLVAKSNVNEHIKRFLLAVGEKLPTSLTMLLLTKYAASAVGEEQNVVLDREYNLFRLADVQCNGSETSVFAADGYGRERSLSLSGIALMALGVRPEHNDLIARRIRRLYGREYEYTNRVNSICDFPFFRPFSGICSDFGSKRRLRYVVDYRSKFLLFYSVEDERLSKKVLSIRLSDISKVTRKNYSVLLHLRDGKPAMILVPDKQFEERLCLLAGLAKVSNKDLFPHSNLPTEVSRRREVLEKVVMTLLPPDTAPSGGRDMLKMLEDEIKNEMYEYALSCLARLLHPRMPDGARIACARTKVSRVEFMDVLGEDEQTYTLALIGKKDGARVRKEDAAVVSPEVFGNVFKPPKTASERFDLSMVTYASFYKVSLAMADKKFCGPLKLRLEEGGVFSFWFCVVGNFFGYFSTKDSEVPLFAINVKHILEVRTIGDTLLAIEFDTSGWPIMLIETEDKSESETLARALQGGAKHKSQCNSKPPPESVELLGRARIKETLLENEIFEFLHDSLHNIIPCPYAYSSLRGTYYVDFMHAKKGRFSHPRAVPATLSLTYGWCVVVADTAQNEILRFSVASISGIRCSERNMKDTEIFWFEQPTSFPVREEAKDFDETKRPFFRITIFAFLEGRRRKVTMIFKVRGLYDMWMFVLGHSIELYKHYAGDPDHGDPKGVFGSLLELYKNSQRQSRSEAARAWISQILSEGAEKRPWVSELPSSDKLYSVAARYYIYELGILDTSKKFLAYRRHWKEEVDLLNWPIACEFECKPLDGKQTRGTFVSWAFVVFGPNDTVQHLIDLRVHRFELNKETLDLVAGPFGATVLPKHLPGIEWGFRTATMFTDFILDTTDESSLAEHALELMKHLARSEEQSAPGIKQWQEILLRTVVRHRFSKFRIEAGRPLSRGRFTYSLMTGLFYLFDPDNQVRYYFRGGSYVEADQHKEEDGSTSVEAEIRMLSETDAECVFPGRVIAESEVEIARDILQTVKKDLSWLPRGAFGEKAENVAEVAAGSGRVPTTPLFFESSRCIVAIHGKLVELSLRIDGTFIVFSGSDGSETKVSLSGEWNSGILPRVRLVSSGIINGSDALGKFVEFVVIEGLGDAAKRFTGNSSICIAFPESEETSEFFMVLQGAKKIGFVFSPDWYAVDDRTALVRNLRRAMKWIQDTMVRYVQSRIYHLKESIEHKSAETDKLLRDLEFRKANLKLLRLWVDRILAMLLIVENGMNPNDTRPRGYAKRDVKLFGETLIGAGEFFLIYPDKDGNISAYKKGKTLNLIDVDPESYCLVFPSNCHVLPDGVEGHSKSSCEDDLRLFEDSLRQRSGVRSFAYAALLGAESERVIDSALSVFGSIRRVSDFVYSVLRSEIERSPAPSDFLIRGEFLHPVFDAVVRGASVKKFLHYALLGVLSRVMADGLYRTQDAASDVLNKVSEELLLAPDSLKALVGISIKEATRSLEVSEERIVMNLVLYGLLVPAITWPERYGILPERPGLRERKRLVTLARFLRTVLGGYTDETTIPVCIESDVRPLFSNLSALLSSTTIEKFVAINTTLNQALGADWERDAQSLDFIESLDTIFEYLNDRRHTEILDAGSSATSVLLRSVLYNLN